MIAGFTKDREMALSRLRQKYAKNKQQNMNNYSIAEDNYVVNNDSNMPLPNEKISFRIIIYFLG